MYKIVQGGVIRTEDNAWIPINPELNDYNVYLAWVAEGNVAEQQDEVVSEQK